MSLNIGDSGVAKPYAKYNSKADKWLTRGEAGDVEIDRPTFVADLKNIVTGWLRFREGQPPERVIDPSLEQKAPSPGKDFKRGFVLACYSPKYFGGQVEIASASIHMCRAIRDLYSDYLAQRDEHPGQLPLVTCTGAEPMKDRHGVNYKPKLELVGWTERPEQLTDASPVEPHEVWQGPVSPAAPATPAPAAQPASSGTDPSTLPEF